jgi:hypothetical protein
MIKNVINLIVLNNIYDLDYFQTLTRKSECVEILTDNVITNIYSNSKLMKIMLLVYLFGLGIVLYLFFIFNSKNLNFNKNKFVIKILSIFPMFDMLNKLIRNLSFIKIYDINDK